MRHFIKQQNQPLFHTADETCGCGCDDQEHEHGHHHHDDDDCGCGCDHHEHEHAHHHHDDDSCNCGCDHHEHEHEHHLDDDDCDCGCDHHEHKHAHSHEHHDDDDCDCGCDHHDHEHEHKHEHKHHHHDDDDCDCGCGHHEHEHSHSHEHHHHDDDGCDHHHHDDDDCDCGCGCDHHDHEHEHEHHQEHSPERIREQDDGTPKKIYILENLGCAHCAAKMEAKIQELPGVTYATITYATKQLRLSADTDYEKLLPKIQEICSSIESQVRVIERDPTPKASGSSHSDASSSDPEEAEEKKELIGILAGAALFVAAVVMGIAKLNEWLILPVFVASYLVLGGPVLLEAGRNILHGQIFDENFLMSIATIGAFCIREYPEAVGVMLFYRIGEFFEHKAVERSRGQIMEALDLRPEVVNLLSGSEIRTIPAGEAKVGDLLLIRPGDRIPLDGVITDGSSRLDTSPITGEPVPVSVHTGDKAISGCVNTSGQLTLRVEKPLEESMVTRIMNSVENAAASKPKIDRFITKFSRIYTPTVVAVALLTAVVPSLYSGNWNYWVYTALTFLVMSCPCALVLSIPLTFFSGIGAASKRKILFKGGVAIESLSRLGAVVMDKTGTITEGNFRLQKVVPAAGYSEETMLRICAGCEQHSTHPIAHSIVSAANERGIHPAAVFRLEEIAGHGILASMEEGTVLCGNRKLMETHQVKLPKLQQAAYGSEVFLAVNGAFAGSLIISDTLKADAKSAVSHLKAMGLRTIMLTGDSEESAKAVAAETGIDDVYARLLPQDKLDILKKVRNEHGAVMFIGDGINDAPVLAGADVGAAMGSGADAAIEAADAVFMNSSVEAIPQSIAIARSTNRIAVQNVVFALAIKIAVMILGLIGYANMWMAVFADSGVTMLCVLNSIRILYKK